MNITTSHIVLLLTGLCTIQKGCVWFVILNYLQKEFFLSKHDIYAKDYNKKTNVKFDIHVLFTTDVIHWS